MELIKDTPERFHLGFFDHGTSQLYHIYLYDIIVINTRTLQYLPLICRDMFRQNLQ